jgi:hypothetical protein
VKGGLPPPLSTKRSSHLPLAVMSENVGLLTPKLPRGFLGLKRTREFRAFQAVETVMRGQETITGLIFFLANDDAHSVALQFDNISV